jgi:hypothetical protein
MKREIHLAGLRLLVDSGIAVRSSTRIQSGLGVAVLMVVIHGYVGSL